MTLSARFAAAARTFQTTVEYEQTGAFRQGWSHARRLASGLLMALLCFTIAPSAEERMTHVHIGDRLLNVVYQRALRGSGTFRSVVDRLDGAAIQVFVGCDALIPDTLSGRLLLLANVSGVRYVRIGIRCTLSPKQQLAFLAHELQHAVEIGDNTDVTDLEGMESYYNDNGFRTQVPNTYRAYETDAAIAVQRLVDQEMNEVERNKN